VPSSCLAFYLILFFFPVLSSLVLPHLILWSPYSCLDLPCLVLCCGVFSCLVLSCLFSSCLAIALGFSLSRLVALNAKIYLLPSPGIFLVLVLVVALVLVFVLWLRGKDVRKGRRRKVRSLSLGPLWKMNPYERVTKVTKTAEGFLFKVCGFV
jgi:hypothetical protein